MRKEKEELDQVVHFMFGNMNDMLISPEDMQSLAVNPSDYLWHEGNGFVQLRDAYIS